jgi:hypothetical protein
VQLWEHGIAENGHPCKNPFALAAGPLLARGAVEIAAARAAGTALARKFSRRSGDGPSTKGAKAAYRMPLGARPARREVRPLYMTFFRTNFNTLK